MVYAIARDWSVNGILTLSSGVPFTVTSADRANTGQGRYQRADCIGDPLPDGFDQTLNRWFDTAAFAAPATFTYGNCSYNSLRGPGLKSMNLSVFRTIPLPNERRIELRIETFNLFNWVDFGLPAANVSKHARRPKRDATRDQVLLLRRPASSSHPQISQMTQTGVRRPDRETAGPCGAPAGP